jgi:alpha-tubulin suppressor-like RCC1 family protein
MCVRCARPARRHRVSSLNSAGQLGNGTTTSSDLPVLVSNLSDAVEISTGLSHACALLADGTVKCWGNGGYGQVGDGTRHIATTPVTAHW